MKIPSPTNILLILFFFVLLIYVQTQKKTDKTANFSRHVTVTEVR